MIEAIDLTVRRRGRAVLDAVSFDVRPGQVTGVLGGMDAGKTTLLRRMVQLDRSGGETLFDGRPYRALVHPMREVGLVLEETTGYPDHTVRGHLRLMLATDRRAAVEPAARGWLRRAEQSGGHFGQSAEGVLAVRDAEGNRIAVRSGAIVGGGDGRDGAGSGRSGDAGGRGDGRSGDRRGRGRGDGCGEDGDGRGRSRGDRRDGDRSGGGGGGGGGTSSHVPTSRGNVRRGRTRPSHRIDAVLDIVGLAGQSRTHIADLTDGMAIRLSIAAALLGDPMALLLEMIVAGELGADRPLVPEEIGNRFEVSRTVVRESLRVLEAKGLVSARPNVGTRIRPVHEWNLLDPDVIEWRALGPYRGDQARELIELRQAFEPLAAHLVAARAVRLPEAVRARLAELSDVLMETAATGDRAGFHRTDAELHALLLRATENRMLEHLATVVCGALEITGVRSYGCSPEAEVDQHTALVDQVLAGDGVGAAEVVSGLLRRVPSPAASAHLPAQRDR